MVVLVVCNGMLRSGSTMQYNLARSLVAAAGAGGGEGFFTEAELAAMGPRIAEWQSDSRYHIVKTHDVCEWLLDAGEHTRICYIHRDLRDVAASIRRKWPERELMPSLDRAVDAYRRITAGADVLVQKYEDFALDPVGTAVELTRYLRLDLSPEAIRGAVEENSVERAAERAARIRRSPAALVSRIGRKLGVGRNHYDTESLLHDDHISETAGAVGVWRKVLTETESTEIEQRFGDWMRAAGYPAG
jgi:hypothetical protein